MPAHTIKILHTLSVTVLLILLTVSLSFAQDAQPTPTNTPIPPPVPTETINENGYTLELFFSEIVQGSFGVVQLDGVGIQEARALFISEQFDFFYLPDEDAWYALIVVNMDTVARPQPLRILIRNENSEDTVIEATVTVTAGGFIRQEFTLAADRAYLIDPEVERNEFARLGSITGETTEEKLWTEAGFQSPIIAEFTSPFGVYRTLNETVQTRHTGWDQKAVTGTPIQAMGGGEVAFAGRLDIRGNYVMIDHGFGIYSGYAHLSQIHVTRGQSIAPGQIIGLSGNTGRSNGPHLHWEVAVNGDWVDSRAFIETWLP